MNKELQDSRPLAGGLVAFRFPPKGPRPGVIAVCPLVFRDWTRLPLLKEKRKKKDNPNLTAAVDPSRIFDNSSVQFNMVSLRSRKPMCAPPRISGV